MILKVLVGGVVFVAGVVVGATVGIAGYRDSVPFSEAVEGRAGDQLDDLSDRFHLPKLYRKAHTILTKTFDALPWKTAARN
jgi:hypothetical protein